MPSRIAKGFSLCTAVVGVLCVVTGIGIAICAWVLNAKLPDQFRYQDKDKHYDTISIGHYWWGGMIYVLPGIMGIIAGCTRSVIAMVFYLIFNLICCICSLVVVVMCGLVLLVWATVDHMLQTGACHTTMTKSCMCTVETTVERSTFVLYGGSCQMFMNIQVIIGAMVSMAALSSLLSFVASYVSCCALCNQEPSDVGGIIISGGAGVYQPPPIVISNTGLPSPQVNAAYPPPPYAQGGYDPHYAPQSGHNPHYAPQSGHNPQYAPQSGHNPQYAPQSGHNPQYAPQAGYNPPVGGAGLHDVSAQGAGFNMPYTTSDKSNLVGNEYR